MTWRVKTGPESEPVTLEQAKLQCRVDIDDDDLLISAYIATAREVVEGIAGRALINQTLELILDDFPASTKIRLPKPPLQSVSSIKYYDVNETETEFAAANYLVSTDDDYGGWVVLKDSAAWPVISNPLEIGAVRIEYVAGYGDDDSAVPNKYKQAVLLLVGHYYENREAIATSGAMPKEIPLAVSMLLGLDRVWH